MDWNDLRFFLAVAGTGSLSGASEQLGVSPSTVSRRIGVLEAGLQVRLFRHRPDGYRLTEAGLKLLPAAERAEAQMRLFERCAREKEGELVGPVRIEAPELLGQDMVLPALAGFIENHPEIRVELRSGVRSVRLTGEEADIVLRLIRPERGRYRQRRVGQVSFGLYASQAHIMRHGTPSRVTELHQHRILGWTDDLRGLLMATWLDKLCPRLQPALRLSSLGAQLVAAQQGLGWAVLPTFAAKPVGLQAASLDAQQLAPDLWLLIHEQAAALPRVQMARDILLRALPRLLKEAV
ncbi:LysR family transcriptional regulator [Pseudoroseomonas globiformis]|uniref:LysR family transcriptional regulator n=1 Tax=Teichococcus globiformis TaxID=2307229 RepID=A0ABV7G1G1_9PROT